MILDELWTCPVLRGSCCLQMGEMGAGVTSDIVKVMSADPVTPGLSPGPVIPQCLFNKTKQHTHAPGKSRLGVLPCILLFGVYSNKQTKQLQSYTDLDNLLVLGGFRGRM